MNISNNIKNKIINHENVSKETRELFLKYIINKAIVITKHMYNSENYSPMFLLAEICYSYNLTSGPIIDNKNHYIILNINNNKYLIDIAFDNNKIPKLAENKYIEYTDDIFKLYLKIKESK